jgi:hypothetical protein
VSAAVGLAANTLSLAKREVRQLPEQITALPMTAATKVLHAGIVIRTRFDGLVERGDEVLHIASPEAANGSQRATSHSTAGKHESDEDDTVVPIRPPSRFDAVADGFELFGDEPDDDVEPPEFNGSQFGTSEFDSSGDE